MNYIRIFNNAHAMSIKVGNFYSEDQLMHIFLYKFHQDGNNSAKISEIFIYLILTYWLFKFGKQLRFWKKYLQRNHFSDKVHYLWRYQSLCRKVFQKDQTGEKKLARMFIRTTGKRNGHHKYVLDVDFKIT